MHHLLRVIIFLQAFFVCAVAQSQQTINVQVHENKTHQTIENFGASDAWSCQFVGNWPAAKKNAIANLLFSMDTMPNGNAKGIGLSMWRYNIGVGSAEQGDSSNITDTWHRAALVNEKSVFNNDRIKAQNWFLLAAKQRGVQQFLGFFNSPPVDITVNCKAHATNGKSNISSYNYHAFANYAAEAITSIHQSTGVLFNYISPVNEPQWGWSDNKQEGCPYNNEEISGVVKSFDSVFKQQHIHTKILIAEAGQLNFLLPYNNSNKANQVNEFFNPASLNYVGNLSNVYKAIAAHSYFTTSPFDNAIALRNKVRDSIAQIKNLALWQSEYCILGDNAGEINGSKRDTGIEAALYVAKVIYEDLAEANASAWQWWLAVSPYDYKDGLIYIDKDTADGNFYDSKILWALGNYSRFVRPGMKRIEVENDSKDILVSGYRDMQIGKTVLVFVNASDENKAVTIHGFEKGTGKKIITYTTSSNSKLAKATATLSSINIAAKSIVTAVIK